MKEFGVLVPIITPCTNKGEIDYLGLVNVYRYMINAGCNGVFVAGSTGRGPWFSRDERNNICKSIAVCKNDTIMLFAGCMGTGLKEMLENASAMADAGADMAVVTAPFYFKYNQKEIEYIFLKFADESPIPVLIYDIPDFTGTKLDTGMVLRLARHGNIKGFKDSSSDMNRFKELAGTLEAEKDFYLLQGKEHILAETILAGASGLVVSLLHIAPEPFVRLYKAVVTRQTDLAFRMQTEITRLYELVTECFNRRPGISTLFYLLDYSLRSNGICDNILMEYEGDFPGWLELKAQEAIDICKSISLIK
jgi:Dihydrodipicolinate synthase/N-acetylneuraminate lyase